MAPIDMGDAPTWIAGGFAAIAAYCAWGTLKSQRQQIGEQQQFIAEQSATLALERSELRAVAESRRRAQAELVEITRSPVLRVWNGSGAPLRDVQMMFGTQAADSGAEIFFAPGMNFGRTGDRQVTPVPVLGAGRTFSFSATPEPVRGELRRLLFTDDAGVRWSLDEHGALEEIPPEPSS
ncbi:hypothetical protein ACFYWY_27410 [Streptomyces sp. NPDC002870]|uniref:hypothetical protein n=1 Tax=Streptomyces sp. NPDC002870 TaxID=3364666 RepID=UPI003696DC3C